MGALKKGGWDPLTNYGLKICVSKETKDIYVKAFNMTTNKDEASCCKCNVNANSIVQHVIQNKNGIIKWM